MSWKCIQRGSLFLNEVRVPEANPAGALNGAFGSAMQTFTRRTCRSNSGCGMSAAS